ncbi:MAG: hypothetical protein ACRENI_14360 [Gemmatimonadaceae bacterium]
MQPLLAMIVAGDPAIWWVWLVALSLAALGYAVCARRPWHIVLVFPVTIFVAWAIVARLQDPLFGLAALREAGQGYVVQSYLAAGAVLVVPWAGVVAGIVRQRRKTVL